jgi:hypothetical protein
VGADGGGEVVFGQVPGRAAGEVHLRSMVRVERLDSKR